MRLTYERGGGACKWAPAMSAAPSGRRLKQLLSSFRVTIRAYCAIAPTYRNRIRLSRGAATLSCTRVDVSREGDDVSGRAAGSPANAPTVSVELSELTGSTSTRSVPAPEPSAGSTVRSRLTPPPQPPSWQGPPRSRDHRLGSSPTPRCSGGRFLRSCTLSADARRSARVFRHPQPQPRLLRQCARLSRQRGCRRRRRSHPSRAYEIRPRQRSARYRLR
jgi:hypothetical protein